MTTYTPKPGSVADRAIAHLQSQPPAGAEVSTSALAEAVGATGDSLRMCLQPALDAGAVFARKRGGHVRSPMFWSLADHAARDARTGEASSPANGSQKPNGEWHRSSTATAKAGRMPEGLDSQHVLKAEGASPDATDRDAPATTSPVGGPMGAGQTAAAAPSGDGAAPLFGRNATISMSGEIAIVAECGTVILFDAQRGRQLVTWLAGRGA